MYKTRVDCQLANESQEYDWQNKWYECFGQSLYYGMKTGNINGCVLIAKNNKWQKYTDRALETIKYYNLPIILAFTLKLSSIETTPIIVNINFFTFLLLFLRFLILKCMSIMPCTSVEILTTKPDY
jgi:hypothetical protein